MNENHVYDMIIVGGGPGGYTSALYAARAGFDTIVLGASCEISIADFP